MYSRFRPFKKQGRNKNLSKHRFSPKGQETPPTKDKSISGRRADGFEGRLGPCLRWEASDGGAPLSGGIRVIPPTLPTNTSLSTRTFDDIRRPDVRSVPLTDGCKEGKKKPGWGGKRAEQEWIFHIHIIKLNCWLASPQNHPRWC